MCILRQGVGVGAHACHGTLGGEPTGQANVPRLCPLPRRHSWPGLFVAPPAMPDLTPKPIEAYEQTSAVFRISDLEIGKVLGQVRWLRVVGPGGERRGEGEKERSRETGPTRRVFCSALFMSLA